MLICYGRFSGTEDGWIMFENEAGTFEERSTDWEEVIVLNQGFTYYRRKSDGLIAGYGKVMK